MEYQLTDHDLNRIIKMFHEASGIELSEKKRNLICGRLNGRLRSLSLKNYQEYISFIENKKNEVEFNLFVDLLTTNETYFFREPKHFDMLANFLDQWDEGRPPEIWSAACSSGEEPYTLAMLMYERFGAKPWKIKATDLSGRVLKIAKQGLYPDSRCKGIPLDLLKKYCLKGNDEYSGYILMDDLLRSRIEFSKHNLLSATRFDKKFDYIFLRNVLIYFDKEKKTKIVKNVTSNLNSNGYLFVGHSESLNGVVDFLEPYKTSVYKLPKQ